MADTLANNANRQSEEINVLRVGVVRDKQVVDERIVKAGEAVTIGTGQFNTFTFDDVEAEVGERFELFGYKHGAYYLRFAEHMSGMIKADDDSVSIADLKSGTPLAGQRAIERKGDYTFTLSESSKGRVEFAGYSFVFHFVSSPAVVVQHKAITNEMVFDDDDKNFASILGLFSVTFGALMWWVTIQPRPELLEKDEVDELIAGYLELEEPPEEPEMPTEPSSEEVDDSKVDPNKTAEAKTEPEEKVEEPQETAEKEKVESVEQVEKRAERSGKMSDEDRAAAEAVVAKSFLFQQIGTVGEGSGVVTSAFGGEDGASADLDQILDGVTDGQVATNDAQMRTRGQIDKSGRAETKVGVVSAEGKGGSSVAGPGPKTVAPKSNTKINKIDSAMGTCSDEINKTVRKYLSQVKTCHDISLKSNPAVAGRVEVDVEITDGKVTMASVSKNTTGDSGVATCIERKVKRWNFPSTCSDMAVFPFALSPKK